MELFEAGMVVTDDRLNAGENGIKVFATSGTMASTSYVNIPGVSATSFSFTKYSLTSKIRVDMKITAFVDAGSTGLRLGVQINGIDYDVALGYYTTANQYMTVSGFAYVTNNQTPGTYTLQARWKRNSGTGTFNTLSTISELDFSAREVAL